MMRRTFATEPLASSIVAETLPGPATSGNEQLIDHLKASSSTGWDQVGTCQMGNGAVAVVDERSRVRGIERSRVIDALIMPKITAGTTKPPAIKIGEKVANMIRADAALSYDVELISPDCWALFQADKIDCEHRSNQ